MIYDDIIYLTENSSSTSTTAKEEVNSKVIKANLRRAKRINENKYESFADERFGCNAKIFINGKSYFEDLFYSMMNAKNSIYICGYGVSPELFLIRPMGQDINNNTRIMDVLSTKARENVMVKVLIYKEVPYTINLNSLHAKETLNSLHPNIRVRRYPYNSFPYGSWTNHEKLVVIDNELAYVGGMDLFWGRWDDENMSIKEESNPESLYKWPGVDFSNDRLRDRSDLSKYLKEYMDRDTEPRMPWHDITCRIEGPAVIDVYRHFLQRWYYVINRKITYPISFDDYLNSINIPFKNISQLHKGSLSCQIVRSACKWSVGTPLKEHSILNAYYDLIDNSKYYILIQNQFFISNSFYPEESVCHKNKHFKLLNSIALHIRKRIEKAFSEKQKFKVIIIIPLLPGFSGSIENTQAIKTIVKYTYRTICRHRGMSLVERLIDSLGDKYLDYINFFSIRNHCDLRVVPKTEICYIHAKMMIVDDLNVIIGSANINDRSILGDRDSELAVVIKGGEGEDKLSSWMNGQVVNSSKLAYDFRVNLLKMHLGLNESELDILVDPLSDDCNNLLVNRARKNTEVYREVFKVIPDDIYTTFEDFKFSYTDECSSCLKIVREKYSEYKDQIKGLLVEFPLDFLKKQNLDRGVFSKEKVVNVDVFL